MTVTKYTLPENRDYAPAFAQRESPCAACHQKIPRDAKCLWVQDVGLFHPECVEGVPEETDEEVAEKRELIEMVTPLDIRYESEEGGYYKAFPTNMEDGSNKGFLRSIYGYGLTEKAAISNLFEKMCQATLLVLDATGARKHFLWHEHTGEFIEVPTA